MKTVEEVVDAILDEQSGYLDYDGVKIAAIIRADREVLLTRVEEDFHSILWGAVGANPKMINPICDYVLAAVRKEAL